MRDIVLLSDPAIARIPVEECGEALVDLRTLPELRIDARLADQAGAYAHVRRGVAERLLAAQELLSAPLRLLVVEGFRPLSLQVRYFTDYAEQLRRRWPDWSAEHVHRQASRSLSPPEVAPHVCGAAVDLTLCDGDQVELDLGTEVNAAPEECDEACYTAAPNIGPTARRHRQLLGHALNSVGLVNYPTEWWHWSFGDRYWVLGTGAAAAVYGPVQGPVRGPDD